MDLDRRELLNPGQPGRATFLLGLRAERTASGRPAIFLKCRRAMPRPACRPGCSGMALDGSQPVQLHGLSQSLQQALAGKQLPEQFTHLVGLHAQAVLDALVPLSAREYSIASLPSDGELELIVRQERHADGSLGLGSGWLTEGVALPGQLLARVRRNSGFHAPDDARPVILIGNGTGLAGLRSLLRARIRAGYTDNWLLFGERNATHDFYCRSELQNWLVNGELARLDLAFSRDQAAKVYVQDRLRESAETLREWLARGASLYVCGSLDGMAGGVDQVLQDVLGKAVVDELLEQGRYRRDVY